MTRTKRNILIISAVAVVAIVATCAYIAPFFLDKNGKDTIVYIYPEMTNKQFADSLKSRLGEDFGNKTAQMAGWLDIDLSKRTGAYMVDSGMTPINAAKQLQRGGQTGIKFTFNYVRTAEQFAERVSRRLLMSKNDLLSLLTDPAFCQQYGKTPQTIVSIFFPDSYEFYWTTKPEDFVAKMYKNYTNFWNEERKAKAKAIKLTPDEVSTLASIVEEETAKRDERGKVARLYINRINKGMLLQADPTVKFGIGDFSIRRITRKMLQVESPYNTYKHKGLPPGPIRLPEKSTLDAVLNAPTHNYVYMCAKEDFSGYHNFAVGYAEHKANARRYQRELNRRGIR